MTKDEQITDPYILGIDDDSDFNNLLKVVFKKNDLKFVGTTGPDQFAHYLKEFPPLLSLIDLNLDVAMGAGFSLLQAVRKKMGPDFPIIILSRRSSREDIGKALELGANDFIPKPIDDAYLIQKVNQYIQRIDEKPLPFYRVSEKDWQSEITFPIKIASISEFGLTIESPHFMSKGTYLTLRGDLISSILKGQRELSLTIHNSWIDDKTQNYMGFCEFDFEDINQMSAVRNYILNNYQNLGLPLDVK